KSIGEKAGLGTLAISQPADPSGQALKLDSLLGHADPSMQRRVVREEIEDRLVGDEEIVRITRQGRPAEWSFSFAEKRPDEQRNKAAHLEGVGHSCELRLTAEIVAVIESDGAALLELEHGAHVTGHRGIRKRDVLRRIAGTQIDGLLVRNAGRNISIQFV